MAHPHEVAVLHKDTYQSAGATEEEGEQEGQGEEAVLLGSVDVETLVVRDQKTRGNGDATQHDGCYAQGVENDHLADHTVGDALSRPTQPTESISETPKRARSA